MLHDREPEMPLEDAPTHAMDLRWLDGAWRYQIHTRSHEAEPWSLVTKGTLDEEPHPDDEVCMTEATDAALYLLAARMHDPQAALQIHRFNVTSRFSQKHVRIEGPGLGLVWEESEDDATKLVLDDNEQAPEILEIDLGAIPVEGHAPRGRDRVLQLRVGPQVALRVAPPPLNERR